ncbi:MAG: tRNA lysidine(34) synthetase TilS, partial [Verrucomicrobia bacterium]|nr:tRNA lysidine(34) synthetase TilS [Verrucomicrobiota bacterium]
AAPEGDPPGDAWVDAGRVGRARLTARSWRPGDRIRPLGLNGSKKIQDLFTDLKVPKEQRARVPVIECRGEIVWVPGSRVSRDWAVRGPRAPSLHLRARNLDRAHAS